jgi:hypothetical protein
MDRVEEITLHFVQPADEYWTLSVPRSPLPIGMDGSDTFAWGGAAGEAAQLARFHILRSTQMCCCP